jgi:malate/lactate dehydrogenase
MSMKISIFGAAGTLGSCTAYRLATQGLADELVMIDVNRNLLKSHVMDIQTAVTGLYEVNIREGSEEDLAGSHIVINNAGAPWRVVSSRMEKLQENMPIIREIAEKILLYCPEAVVITSTNPVDPLNLAMHLYTGMDRKRLLGYTLNDSIRFKRLAAEALGVQSTRVQGMVIGEHGDFAVLLFSSLTVDGHSIILDDKSKAEIAAAHRNTLKNAIRLGTGWTSGWTSSVGLAHMVAAITGKNEAVIPCSVLLQGEYGIEGISLGVPAKLGPQGVDTLHEIELTREEKDALKKGVSYLEEVNRKMKTYLTK